MTVGKDVSALFPDVVNCMQTDNLELKKLVYLYLMNYAKSQPDMAIMAVNTFVKVRMPNAFVTPTPSTCTSFHSIVYFFFLLFTSVESYFFLSLPRAVNFDKITRTRTIVLANLKNRSHLPAIRSMSSGFGESHVIAFGACDRNTESLNRRIACFLQICIRF